MQPLAPSPSLARGSALRAGVLALAAVQLLQGLLLAFASGAFYDAVADFGPRNDHDLRDMAAFYLASAAVLAVAAGRPSWRAPALALVGLQFALHAVNHLVDVGGSYPGWVGPFDVVTLALGALVIGALYRAAAQQEAQR
jgi:nitroreductase